MATHCKEVEVIFQQKCKHFQGSTAFQYFPTMEDKNVHYDTEILDNVLKNMRQQYCISMQHSKLFKDVETQTQYRESETQTLPWEPPYKVHTGHDPEVLTLTHLTWNHGLPAGMHELDIINRTKMKKAWEMFLPPMDTEANIKIRKCIIKMLEKEQWAFRDAEIQHIMDMRLQLMDKLSHLKESKHNEKIQNRFKRLKNNLGKYRDERISLIRHNLKRDLRKLYRSHCNKYELQKKDIIQSYINRTSELTTSQLQFEKCSHGLFTKMRKQSSIDYMTHESIEKIDALSKTLSSYAESKPKRSSPTELCIRETRWTDDKLQKLHMDLKAMRLNIMSPEIPTLMRKKHKPPILPSTPYRTQQTYKETVIDQSALCIQETIRGRATQCMMFEGRNRCRELIKELQSTHEMKGHTSTIQQIEDQEILDIQHKQRDALLKEEYLCEILNSLEGATVCGVLDYLSKELVRLKDERNAHAFALMAEKERLMREAAEAGRRQLESNRRRECDEMFRQIIKVDQDTIEIYLDDIIREQVEKVSYQNAEQHILQFLNHVEQISMDTMENMTDLAEEEMVADMIYNFVLPEVGKFNARKQIKEKQQSYLQSAHEELYEKSLDSQTAKLTRNEDLGENEELLYKEDYSDSQENM